MNLRESIYKSIEIVFYRWKLANVGQKKGKTFGKLGQSYYELLKKGHEHPLTYPFIHHYTNQITFFNEEIEKLQDKLNELERAFPVLKKPTMSKKS
jgi:hypothetical protein